MPYNYTDQQVQQRVHSGKDSRRAASADQLYAQATQPPHEDDYGAYQKLAALSGVSNPGEGWATMDAKNYGRMLLNKMGAGQQYDTSYGKAHDGGGFVHSLGGVLKKLAPAAMLIPGVGMAGAGLIAAGVNSGGSLMEGEGLDLGGSLKDALLAGAGNKVLGNGLGSGSSNLGFGSTPGVEGAPDIGGMGSQKYNPYTKPGAAYAPGGGAAMNASYQAATGGGPNILSSLKDQFIDPKTGKFNVELAGKLGGAGLKVYGDARQRNSQERVQNANLDLQKRELQMYDDHNNQMQPYRDMALKRLGGMMQQPRGNSIFRYGQGA